MWNQRPWSLLEDELAHMHQAIVDDWIRLIENPQTNERQCLNFVRDHAGMFFNRFYMTPITISELSLGSDYRIDFVIASEGFSGGTHYKLIELESPNSKQYTQKGKTSARLSGAIDQILEWRRWISQHRSQARKIFPSNRWKYSAQPTFSYLVVMGRRSETSQVQDKIWSRIHDQNIEICSFDRLTSYLSNTVFRDEFPASVSAEGDKYKQQKNLLNMAVSPFTKAIPDSTWRKTTMENPYVFGSHLIPPYLDHLVREKFLNQERLNQFDRALKNYPNNKDSSLDGNSRN